MRPAWSPKGTGRAPGPSIERRWSSRVAPGYGRFMAAGAAGGALAGIVIGRNIAAARKGIADAKERWGALASKGYAYSIEHVEGVTAASGSERPRLDWTVGDATASVRIVTDVLQMALTIVTSPRRTPLAGVVGVHPSPGGVLGHLRAWLGQDIEVGDEVFDEAYLVTAKPASLATALLVPSVRDLVSSLGARLVAFQGDEESARVILHGIELDEDALGDAVRLAVAATTYAPPNGV